MRRVALAVAALAAAAIVIVTLAAPQVFVLIREGFPGAVWPVAGDFVSVPGVVPADPPPGSALPAQTAQMFADSEGRALLSDRDGQLVHEAYGPGLTRDDRLNSYSLVKSLVGVLVLRAVADGRVPGLDVRLPDLLGKDAPDITLRAALTMTSGLTFGREPPKAMDDGAFSPLSPLGRLHAFGPQAVMGRMAVDTSTAGLFHYQSVNTALLGAVVEQAYGAPLNAVLDDLIWRPAGAGPAEWRAYPRGGGVTAYCCLYSRPLDWLMIGRFLLDNGGDRPFLPPEIWRDWIAPEGEAVGYGWHLRRDVLDRPGAGVAGRFSYFMGHGGQVVYLLPDQDAVVVRFGARPQRLHSTLYTLLAP